jgi:predicted enzyme related to lactoylglutathione lyase
MTEMTNYAPGLFSWVDLMAPETNQAKRFYGELFGWISFDNDADESGERKYTQFTLRDLPVAGMGEMADEMKQVGMPPVWNSYVTIDDADATAARVQEMGGSVAMPPMQIMTVGRMAIFTDPQGAVFSVWEPQDHLGAGIVNEPGSFCWNELATPDVAGARTFYHGVFGWGYLESGEGPSPYTEIQLGDRLNGGMSTLSPEMQGAPPHWAVYFSVEDCAKTVARLQDLGGSVAVPPTAIPPGTFAVCADPRGGMFHVIALSEAG